MDDDSFQMFKQELEKQCRFAMMAAQDLRKGLISNNAFCIWGSIHSFLLAVGNISKILWHSDGEYSERGDALRQRLSIDDKSPLKPRTARNYLEHFDEYLEEWIKYTKAKLESAKAKGESIKIKGYVDISYGSLTRVMEDHPDTDLKDFFRYFNTDDSSVIFRGKFYELEPLRQSVEELFKKVRR